MRVFELRRLAISGGLVAAAFAVKYAVIGLPNVEPLTLVFFSVGYAYGATWGAFVGAVGEGIFATINPMGAPIAPVWLAQIIGMASAGALGGLVRRMTMHESSPGRTLGTDLSVPRGQHPQWGGHSCPPVEAAERQLLQHAHSGDPGRLGLIVILGAGMVATIVFDLLTNLAMAWSIGPFWVVMVAAIPFAAVHLLSNALLFALIFPILRRWLTRYTSAVADPSHYV
jgi:hypothetical protein